MSDDAMIKLLTRDFMHDPYPALKSLQESNTVVPIENGGFRMWVVTGYDDARAILADPTLQRDLVKNRHTIVKQNLVEPQRRPKLSRSLRRSVLDQDGADHRRLRGLVGRFFSPSRLTELRPRIERLADDLLDSLPLGEPIDLVERYTRPLPITILSDLLGIPADDRTGFPIWETAILTAPTREEVEAAGRALTTFAQHIIELKKANPANDLYTALVQAEQHGQLAPMELISMITLMAIAGLEPSSAIASGILTLTNHRDQLHTLLADPTLLNSCVDEILRFETPFRMLTPRFLDHPMDIGGTTIPAGELILVSTGAANRDPRQFPDPDRFDVARCPKGHLGFSHGPHRCVGAELGRLETSIALDRFFRRFPNTRLAANDVTWRPGIFMRRLDSLPVVLA